MDNENFSNFKGCSIWATFIFLRTFKVTLFYIREILLLPKINRTKVIILDTSSPYTFS